MLPINIMESNLDSGHFKLINLDYSRAETLHPTLDPPPHPSIKGCKEVAHDADPANPNIKVYIYSKEWYS